MRERVTWLRGLTGLFVALGCSDGASTDTPCAAAFPAAPEGTVTWFVAPDGTGDGSACSSPLGHIQGAIDAAADGDVILVAPGDYAEALTITKALSILGAVGTQTETAFERAGADGVSVIIKVPTPDALGVIIKRPADPATNTQNPAGVIIKLPTEGAPSGGPVHLQGLRIEAPSPAGVQVYGRVAAIEDCVVEGSTGVSERIGGWGIYGAGGADVTVRRSRITGGRVGVQWVGSRGGLWDSLVEANRDGGVAILDAPDAIILQGNAVKANGLYGVGVFGGKGIILQQNAIIGTTAASGAGGDGVFLGAGDDVVESEVETLDGNFIEDNARLGLLLAEVRGVIIKNVVSGNLRGGAWLQDGAIDLRIEQNTLSKNRFVGVAVTRGANAIILQNNVLDTEAGETLAGTIGDGIGLFTGASARIESNVVKASARAGVLIDDAAGGAATTVVGNTVTGPRGIILQNPRPEAVEVGENTADVETPEAALALLEEAKSGFEKVK